MSVSSPILRSAARAPGSIDHPTSCPWVLATMVRAPARRSAGASNASGAAAPNQTLSHSCSVTSRAARRATSGVGSIRVVGCRTTSKGCRASNVVWLSPRHRGAYTTSSPAGSCPANDCRYDWIPPGRGGKSFVTNNVRGMLCTLSVAIRSLRRRAYRNYWAGAPSRRSIHRPQVATNASVSAPSTSVSAASSPGSSTGPCASRRYSSVSRSDP